MTRTTRTAASAATIIGLAAFGSGVIPVTRAQAPAPSAPAAAQTPAPAPAPAPAPVPLTGTWKVDPAHTNVNFGIRHLGISTVRGRFDEIAGEIVADAAHPESSSVRFTIQAASIDTNIKMRDDDLRSANYFDVAKYPTITFQSTRVRKDRGGAYVADGDLTIHGVTKAVSLPFRVNGPIPDRRAGGRFGLETQVRLQRSDFGVGGQDKLPTGSLAIGNDVDVTISLEATSAPPAR